MILPCAVLLFRHSFLTTLWTIGIFAISHTPLFSLHPFAGMLTVNPSENKARWNIDEAIHNHLEELSLLNVAKIWSCHKYDFNISLNLGA